MKAIQEGRLTCEERVAEELMNIGRYHKRLNAFTMVFGGAHGFAMSRARELDRSLEKAGPSGPLHGLPITLKDNIFLGGFPTTDGSEYFREFVPSTNADVVDSLLAAGCIPLGKTNLHELALGVTSTSALGGPIRNPLDESRVSGGSSGGSAVSVTLALGAIASVGSDTGGSVRIPAALCGVCGFKPSRGVLSTNGVFPLSATLDHLGLLTKTMEDMVDVFGALSNTGRAGKRSVRIGVPRGYFTDDMDETVSRDFTSALSRLRQEPGFGVRVVGLREDLSKYSRARGTITCKEGSWFYEELLRSGRARREMHKDVLSLMDRGLRTGMIEYMHSLNLKSRSVGAVESLLSGLDALVMPTCPVVAPRIDEVEGKETGKIRALMLRNTELFNTCGFPALTVPMGRAGTSLPSGIQVVGRFGEDARVIEIGERIWRSLHGGRRNE